MSTAAGTLPDLRPFIKSRLFLREQKAPKALVVVPTRELCVQVTSDLTLAGAELGVRH